MRGRARRALEVAATLGGATLGGYAAAFLQLPVAWLLGSMLVVSVLGLLGLETKLPDKIRDLTFFVLGVQAGAGVTPEVIDQIALWPLSFAIQTAGVAAVVLVTYLFLHRSLGWDSRTSLFASLPGALSFVLMAAAQTRADMTKIVIVQSVRLLLLIAFLTPTLAWLTAGEAVREIGAGEGAEESALQYLILIVVCLLGSALGTLSRVPGGMMLGALLGSAVLHGTEIAPVAIPASVGIPALVVLGAFIGGRIRRENRYDLLRLMPASLGAFSLGIIVSAISAAVAFALLPIGFGKIALAYAPGALEALTVLAYQFDLDPAYVAAHHVFRFVCIALLVPVLARRLTARDLGRPDPTTSSVDRREDGK